MKANMRIIVLTLAALLGGNSVASAQNYTLAPTPFQTALDNSGHVINNACIWTYVAGTTTPVATYLDMSGTANSNPIRSDSAGRFTVYLLSGSAYKFVYEGACTPPSHGTTLRTADNISAVPVTSATVDVSGFAGETLTAGQCAYLSDGSGSKIAGQWYKCDSTNTYSSSQAVAVGLVPATIASGATGSIRMEGGVSGLSLSQGAPYFASTSGALTATPPANRRLIGTADTVSSIVLAAGPRLAEVTAAITLDNSIADGRVTVSTGVCIPTADVLAATKVYFAPCRGNRIGLYDGTTWNIRTFTQLSIAVPATTNTNYDVFIYDNAGVPTIELSAAWSGDNARFASGAYATLHPVQDGVPVKSTDGASVDATRRYVGSFRTTGVSGQTEDSQLKRLVSNQNNRVRRTLRVVDTTDSWAYSTATWRKANNSAANQVALLIGSAETPLMLTVAAFMSQTSTGGQQAVAIGEDSLTTPMTTSINITGSVAGANIYVTSSSTVNSYPTVGFHFYQWLEFASIGGTGTFFGDNGGVAAAQSGLTGFIEG